MAICNGRILRKDDSIGQLTADKIKDHLSMIDWKKTLAFCPTPSSNAIFVRRDTGTGLGVKEDDYLLVCAEASE